MLDDKGREVLDDTPVAIPTKHLRAPSTIDEIRRYISMVNREAEASEQETFEEADDLEVGEDYEPSSPWEMSIDQEENWAAFRQQQLAAKAQREAGRNAGLKKEEDHGGSDGDSSEDK